MYLCRVALLYISVDVNLQISWEGLKFSILFVRRINKPIGLSFKKNNETAEKLSNMQIYRTLKFKFNQLMRLRETPSTMYFRIASVSIAPFHFL